MKWVFLLTFLLVLMSGCGIGGSARPLPDAPVTAGAELHTIGATFLWCGALALVLAVGIRLALASSTVTAWIGGIPGPGSVASYAIRFGQSVGAASMGLGTASIWLANHLWLFGVACLCTAAVLVWHHWDDVRDWFFPRTSAIPEKTQHVNGVSL